MPANPVDYVALPLSSIPLKGACGVKLHHSVGICAALITLAAVVAVLIYLGFFAMMPPT